EAVLPVQERTHAEPPDEPAAIRRAQHLVERVALAGNGSGRVGDQVEVVVAEDDDGAVAERVHPAQHAQRSRAPVDETADEPEAAAGGIEGEAREQPLQGAIAPLHVADGVRRDLPPPSGRVERPAVLYRRAHGLTSASHTSLELVL